MRSDPDDTLFAEGTGRLGARLVRHFPLVGGVSARVEAVELLGSDGALRRVVLRQPGAAAWKGAGADCARREFELLDWLHSRGLPVPRPLLLGVAARPYFVMEHVEGARDGVNVPSALLRMAEVLAAIYGQNGAPALPEREDPVAGLLELLSDAQADLRELLLRNPPKLSPRRALLHGDYWLENLLWRDRELVAVLDWEDAAQGDPLSDVACCALELRYKHGSEAVRRFTAHYARFSGLDLAELPLWSAYVAAAALASMHQWGLDAVLEAHMRAEAGASLGEAGEALIGGRGCAARER